VKIQTPEELGGKTIPLVPKDSAGAAQRTLFPFVLAIQLMAFIGLCLATFAYYHLAAVLNRGEVA